MKYRAQSTGLRRRDSSGAAVPLAFCFVLLLGTTTAWPLAPLAQAQEPPSGEEPKRTPGRVIHVNLPITGTVADQVISATRRVLPQLKAAGGRPIIIYQFLPGDTPYGTGSDFYKAAQLADFLAGKELDGVTTVAYLSETVKGHAILPIIACGQISMHRDAQFGEAGIDEDDGPVNPLKSSGYTQIAGKRKTVPLPIVLGMLDPQLEVIEADLGTSVEFVLADDLPALRERVNVVDTKVLSPKGERALLGATRAQHLGIVKYLAPDVEQLARALGLPPDALEDDPLLHSELKPQRIRIEGQIDGKLASAIERMIHQQIAEGVNFIILEIDSPGGSAIETLDLASEVTNLDSNKIRTIAYIPKEAGGMAAAVALACDQIVMHPEARLGSATPPDLGVNPDQQETYQEAVRNAAATIQQIALNKKRPWSLPVTVVDPDLKVWGFRNQRDGRIEYFGETELDAQEKKADWEEVELVTRPGSTLQVDGNEAVRLGLARGVVNNFDQFKQQYGLEGQLRPLAPSWVDHLIDALSHPEFAILLLVIGGAALYMELQSPGIGIGGFVATICFVLFFWGKYMNNTANTLEILLFIVGVLFVALEIFVLPGFGVFGLGGGLLIIASLVLASQTFYIPTNSAEFRELRQSLVVVGGAALGIVAVGALMRRYLPHAPVFRRMMLAPPEQEELRQLAQREALVSYDHLVGQAGVTATQLTPSGKARIGEQLVDVIAEGEVIARDADIVVVDVRGSRVVVRRAGRHDS